MMTQEWEFRDQNCGICDGHDFKVLGFRGGDAHRDGAGEKCRIVQCRTCKTIFPNPMPYPKGVDIRYSDPENYFGKIMRIEHDERLDAGTAILRMAEKYVVGQGKFLDVGCGRGEIVKAASSLGWNALGCDISNEYVEYARTINGVEALSGTVEQLHLESDSFDFISMVEVIEHLYDPLGTVRELGRILRKGGILYISTPNEESIYQAFGNYYYRVLGKDWVVNLCPTWNLYHIQGFSPRSLQYLLNDSGFKVEKTVVYPGSLVVPRRGSFMGRLEGFGIDAVEKFANLIGRSPYMYTWARKV